MSKTLEEIIADVKNGTYVKESNASLWLKISNKLMIEQKEHEKKFRKLGATKKCAKRMARKAISWKKKLYTNTSHSVEESEKYIFPQIT